MLQKICKNLLFGGAPRWLVAMGPKLGVCRLKKAPHTAELARILLGSLAHKQEACQPRLARILLGKQEPCQRGAGTHRAR